jgi:hypothetical protein
MLREKFVRFSMNCILPPATWYNLTSHNLPLNILGIAGQTYGIRARHTAAGRGGMKRERILSDVVCRTRDERIKMIG